MRPGFFSSSSQDESRVLAKLEANSCSPFVKRKVTAICARITTTMRIMTLRRHKIFLEIQIHIHNSYSTRRLMIKNMNEHVRLFYRPLSCSRHSPSRPQQLKIIKQQKWKSQFQCMHTQLLQQVRLYRMLKARTPQIRSQLLPVTKKAQTNKNYK